MTAAVPRRDPESEVSLGVRLLLTPVAAILYALGWLAGVLVTAALWVGATVALGFREARGS